MIVYGVRNPEGLTTYVATKAAAFSEARQVSQRDPDDPGEDQEAAVSRDVVTKIDKALICRLLTAADSGEGGGQWLESSVQIARFRNGRKVWDVQRV